MRIHFADRIRRRMASSRLGVGRRRRILMLRSRGCFAARNLRKGAMARKFLTLCLLQ
jgi:hypothetical protein